MTTDTTRLDALRQLEKVQPVEWDRKPALVWIWKQADKAKVQIGKRQA